jgi:hypothetical protein
MASGMSAGFQLSLELSRIFPVGDLVTSATKPLLDFARSLRKSGSDILVEEDLMNVFGRGRIENKIEEEFKRVVRMSSKKGETLYSGSVLRLETGPGPTVVRALGPKHRQYLSTVLQLSMLGWMHDGVYLASALEEALRKRSRLGVQNSSPDPGLDGIAGTLDACSSQTASFLWDHYVSLVETAFQKRRPSFRYNKNFTCLTGNTLFAAMDYLYIVQSFPEDRKMTVRGLRGCITIIIWAHYLLNLAVLVTGAPEGDIRFGPAHVDQVIIVWDEYCDDPEVDLLDGNMEVIIQAIPEDNSGSTALLSASAERVSLRRYGTTMILRGLNTRSIMVDKPNITEEQILSDVVNLVIAISLIVSQKLRRVKVDQSSTYPRAREQLDYTPEIKLERWRIFDSAMSLFEGVAIIERLVDKTAAQNKGQSFGHITLPSALDQYVKQYVLEERDVSDLKRLIQSLVSLVLLFAHVVEVRNCGDLPLVFMESRGFVRLPIDEMLAEGGNVDLEESTLFYELASLLAGRSFGGDERRSGEYSFLVSDFGWSVFLDTVGNVDPADVRPELLHVKCGVPTIEETAQRRSRIKDANHTWHFDPVECSTRLVMDRGKTYLPRCVTAVTRRTEYYSTRNKELLLSITFEVDESQVRSRNNKFQLHSSFRFMHKYLWSGVRLASPCSHQGYQSGWKELSLDVVTVGGLGEEDNFEQLVPERICIALVMSDQNARWLSVLPGSKRQIMLRGESCCVDCAVKEAGRSNGKWLVII